MITDREYFRKYEAAEIWQEAADEEANERLADMSVEEMAKKIWGDDAAEIFSSMFDDELREKLISELATEGWRPE